MSETKAPNLDVNVDVVSSEQTDGNVHSFEDLESMTETRSDAQIMKEAAKEVKESKEEIKETIKEVANEGRLSENDKQTNLEEQGDIVEAELVDEIKKLHAKFNDEQYEIPEEATMTVKIDGEEVEVPINELKNNYSGKTAWDKKFNELSTERKGFNEERGLIEKYVNEFGELARAGDKIGAMQYLASLSGVDALQFRKDLRDQVLNDYKQVMDMDEHQRKAFELQEENEFLKNARESDTERQVQQQAHMELQQKTNQYQEALGVDENTWQQAQQDLIDEGHGVEEITPDAIGQYLYAHKSYNNAESILGEVSEEYAANDDYVIELGDIMMENPTLSREDFVEMVKEELGSPAEKKSVSNKAATSAKKKEEQEPTSYSERLKQGNKLDQFYSFDELED